MVCSHAVVVQASRGSICRSQGAKTVACQLYRIEPHLLWLDARKAWSHSRVQIAAPLRSNCCTSWPRGDITGRKILGSHFLGCSQTFSFIHLLKGFVCSLFLSNEPPAWMHSKLHLASASAEPLAFRKIRMSSLVLRPRHPAGLTLLRKTSASEVDGGCSMCGSLFLLKTPRRVSATTMGDGHDSEVCLSTQRFELMFVTAAGSHHFFCDPSTVAVVSNCRSSCPKAPFA